jgi:putative peptide maturation system protein
VIRTEAAHANFLLAALDELRALARDGIQPDEAQRRFRTLAAAHGGPKVELCFEPEAHGATFHYDAVVDEPEGATTLRYAADRGLPFVLRGAERLADRDLVRVGEQVLKVRDAIALLDFVWAERPLVNRLLDVCVIEAELERAPVELEDAAVQAAMDRLRTANGLFSAAATERWLAERGMTHEAFERHACDQAAILALRERVAPEPSVAARFAGRAASGAYDVATIARLVVADDARGRAFVEEIAAAKLDFLGATAAYGERYAAVDDAPRLAERVTRATLPAAFEGPTGALRIVRDAASATFIVLHVFARRTAVLDDATRELVAEELFAEWLAGRRAAATIEWNWGPVRGTQAARAS